MQSNYTSVDGATPLMIAAMLGRRDIAETLVQRGAEVNRQDVKSGWTALMQATFHRYVGHFGRRMDVFCAPKDNKVRLEIDIYM